MKNKPKIIIKCANCDKTISENTAKETTLFYDVIKNMYKYTLVCPKCNCRTCTFLRKEEMEEEINDFLQ